MSIIIDSIGCFRAPPRTFDDGRILARASVTVAGQTFADTIIVRPHAGAGIRDRRGAWQVAAIRSTGLHRAFPHDLADGIVAAALTQAPALRRWRRPDDPPIPANDDEELPMSEFLSRAAAAAYVTEKWALPRTANTLAREASEGTGPRMYRAGRAVAYRPADLDEWAESRIKSAPAPKHARNIAHA